MEGDQIGGCCSSLDKNLRGLGPRRLAVVMDRNGWIQVMLKRYTDGLDMGGEGKEGI